jgi:hypothetical protein
MTEAAFNPEFSSEQLHNELVSDWYAKLTDVLLTHGAAEEDGTYYATKLDEDTYVTVTNYPTVSCHVDYRINSEDRSQRASLENRNPIISIEFRHPLTDDVKQGYVLCQPNHVRQDSIIGMALKRNRHNFDNNGEFAIINTSDLTEVSVDAALNSPLNSLLQTIN